MFAVGDVLDATYRIERLLGKGGMAYVYVVSHIRLPRRFALKVITAPIAQGSEYVMRFRREAEILAELEHPNLVTVNDWNTTADGKPYLVMELLSGEDLAQCIHRTGALPPKIAISIFMQVAEALQVVHARDIVHRDLKPANIFLCKNGPAPYFVKVLDFGIAKSAQHAGGAVTENLVLMGTPAYMAPEQAQGNVAIIDARTDQFALALVLYEMLSGRAAFYRRGEAPMQTLVRVISEDPEPLADERLNRAIMRALQKAPDARYASLSDFVSAVIECAPEPLELPARTELPERTKLIDVPFADRREPVGKPPTAPSLAKAVVSNITQPGAEIHPHKRPRPTRPRGFMILGSALLIAGLVAVQAFPRKPLLPQSAATANLGVAMGGNLGMRPAVGGPTAEPPTIDDPQPSLAGEHLTASANTLALPKEPPLPSLPAGPPEKSVRTRHVPLPAHVEPVLLGINSESAMGKFILRCVSDTFGATPRRFHGLVIQLRRTERLKVVSHLAAERSLQLEECLSGLRAMEIPKSVDIHFVAK